MNDLVTIRGDSEQYTVTLVDEAGDAFDLTDCELAFTVEGLLAKTIGAGVTVESPASDGIATVTIDAGDTSAAPDIRTSYRYDVQVTTDTGLVKTPLRGLFIVIPDVTE